jgi:surface protein
MKFPASTRPLLLISLVSVEVLAHRALKGGMTKAPKEAKEPKEPKTAKEKKAPKDPKGGKKGLKEGKKGGKSGTVPTTAPIAPAFDDATIREARDAWFDDKDAATAKYGPIAYWNTAYVTDMESLFDSWEVDSASFNEDLSRWDTSRVTTMVYMFYEAFSFNGDISSWDVSKVRNMGGMFEDVGPSGFNCDLSSWDVSSVTHMGNMFENAESFGQTLCWDTSSLIYSSNMFLNTNGAQFDPIPYPGCL